MKKLFFIQVLVFFLVACENKDSHSDHQVGVSKETYTCPMPEDSIFSDKPGTCAKCGMDLVKMEEDHHPEKNAIYSCPMHPSVIKDQPGACPICGMDLIKKESNNKKQDNVELNALLQPTNELVVSSIPVTGLAFSSEQIELNALGNIAYDTRMIGGISAKVSGRIEKLYVRYKYQKVTNGQRIMDIYSPELLTAQQNLLFLIKNDHENSTLIEAAKEKLLLLGMSNKQVMELIQSGKPLFTISVISNYSGHIHETINVDKMDIANDNMGGISQQTEALALKEGMYIQKGQSVFSVFNPDKAWVILNIYGENQSFVKKGNAVRIIPETARRKDFNATIDFVEPFYRKENKTQTVRVGFNNSSLKIPIGSQVQAVIFGNTVKGFWLPKDAVLSLGLEKVVFQKSEDGFRAIKVITGVVLEKQIQILKGLTTKDSVAANAQFLMDSESFIKVKN